MKVLISGGHFTPALAFLDYALQQNDVEVVFVGREFTQVKSQQPSVEKEEVLRRKVKFIPFHSGKMSRPNIVELLGQFVQLLGGVVHAFQIINQEKPDVFVSFGSYIAVPLAFAAWVKRVPVVTHEQTRTAGVATKIIKFFRCSLDQNGCRQN
jgi:UDP-N-acetylglucosamine--N-acetylmuramyl-(pentapeptide) pyrophosphoryl-undecaprenol N-acetylglucosamine transferase